MVSPPSSATRSNLLLLMSMTASYEVFPQTVDAFQTGTTGLHVAAKIRQPRFCQPLTIVPTKRSNANDIGEDDNDEEVFRTSKNNNRDSMASSRRNDNGTSYDDDDDDDRNNFMDDLTPPPVNFARNSILFSDNPSTKKRNNIMLDVWKTSRTYLPAFLTGAWPWRDVDRMDNQPVAALYNMIVVRLPVVLVGIFYWKQLLLDHHDLVMDFGFLTDGPQVMNPLLVTLVLCFILL